MWVVACLRAAGFVERRALCHTAVATLLPSQHKHQTMIATLQRAAAWLTMYALRHIHVLSLQAQACMHAITTAGARYCLDMQWCTLTIHMQRACCLTCARSQSNTPEVLPSGAAVLRVPQPLERIHGLHGDAALSLRRVDVAHHPAAQWRRYSCSACMLDAQRMQTALPPCFHIHSL